METTSLKGKTGDFSYIAFIDLDRTLINANSGRLLVIHAFKKGLMGINGVIRALLLAFIYRFQLLDTDKIIAGMVSWLRGIPVSTLKDFSEEVFQKFIKQSISDEARNEIKLHKDKKALVIILSSALAPVCKAVAGHLELDDIICTEIEISDGKYTGYPVGKLCFGEEKTSRCKEYCIKNNTTPELSWYYGDSISDLPLLNYVGNPVCINPDKRLLKVALKNKWRVSYWN